MSTTTPALLRTILALANQGYTSREIGRELNIDTKQVCKLRARNRNQNEMQRRLDDMQMVLEEVLILVRQLSKLPASEVERRMLALEQARDATHAVLPSPADAPQSTAGSRVSN